MLSGQHLRCHTDVSGDKMRCGIRLKLNKDNGILIGIDELQVSLNVVHVHIKMRLLFNTQASWSTSADEMRCGTKQS